MCDTCTAYNILGINVNINVYVPVKAIFLNVAVADEEEVLMGILSVSPGGGHTLI
jgi:hypothetical protein